LARGSETRCSSTGAISQKSAEQHALAFSPARRSSLAAMTPIGCADSENGGPVCATSSCWRGRSLLLWRRAACNRRRDAGLFISFVSISLGVTPVKPGLQAPASGRFGLDWRSSERSVFHVLRTLDERAANRRRSGCRCRGSRRDGNRSIWPGPSIGDIPGPHSPDRQELGLGERMNSLTAALASLIGCQEPIHDGSSGGSGLHRATWRDRGRRHVGKAVAVEKF
jgi:hypothetical protein